MFQAGGGEPNIGIKALTLHDFDPNLILSTSWFPKHSRSDPEHRKRTLQRNVYFCFIDFLKKDHEAGEYALDTESLVYIPNTTVSLSDTHPPPLGHSQE